MTFWGVCVFFIVLETASDTMNLAREKALPSLFVVLTLLSVHKHAHKAV